MWNPFKKSKEKQLKEAAASAILDYCKDKVEEEIRNNLKNKNVNDKKLYELLKSKAKIFISEMYNPRNVKGFLGDYKYDIRRTDNEEEYEFIIDGKFYMLSDKLSELERYVLINIEDKCNNVLCYGAHRFSLFTNGEEDIDIGLIIHVPFKELNLSEIKNIK